MPGLIAKVLAAAVLAGSITLPVPARPQPSEKPQPSGSARLSGRVIAADDGQPVRRARVHLSGLPDSERNAGANRIHVSRTVETDLTGRFEFTRLPAGWYSMSVDTDSGFVRSARTRDLTLAEGQALEIPVRLERTGAIAGRVQDENGDGMFGVVVQAVRQLNVGGDKSLSPPRRQATTDDRGEFRLFDLPPGDYYVVATYRPQRETEPPSRSGYANTYYPGSSALQHARLVTVRAGRDTSRVTFALEPCRLAIITIHPFDSHGVPLKRDASVTLTRRDDVYLNSSMRMASRRDDSTFIFTGVAPGDYFLVVTKNTLREEAAYVNVRIDGEDVSLNVQTNTGATLSGRVIVAGRPPGGDGTEVPNVWVSATPPLGTLGVSYADVPVAQVKGTDRFELRGLRGPTVLRADIGLGALLSIRRGGNDIAGKTLEYVGTETIDDVVVELTTKVAQVDVTVAETAASDEPEPVLVLLFSEDPALWQRGYVRYAQATAEPRSDRPQRASAGADALTESRTHLIRLPPGRYLIVAIPDPELDYPGRSGLLEKLRPHAKTLTLAAGETTRTDLEVVKVARK